MKAEMIRGDDHPARFALILASATLYVASFFLPAVGNEPGAMPGYAAFLSALIYSWLFAILGFPQGLACLLMWFPSWCANVVYWTALHRLLRGDRHGVAARGLLAVLLGLSILPWFWSPGFVIRGGYWVWLGSMGLVALGQLIPGDGRRSKGDRIAEIAGAWDD